MHLGSCAGSLIAFPVYLVEGKTCPHALAWKKKTHSFPAPMQVGRDVEWESRSSLVVIRGVRLNGSSRAVTTATRRGTSSLPAGNRADEPRLCLSAGLAHAALASLLPSLFALLSLWMAGCDRCTSHRFRPSCSYSVNAKYEYCTRT